MPASLRTFEIDGATFQSLDAFAAMLTRVLFPDSAWNGNLDALNDMLRGGFGSPEDGFVVRIRNSDLAMKALGYLETSRWYEERANDAYPTSRDPFRELLEQATQGHGVTLFDMIVEIFKVHGAGGRESEDNVILELA
jgi:Barstar (barnase inhibitor)